MSGEGVVGWQFVISNPTYHGCFIQLSLQVFSKCFSWLAHFRGKLGVSVNRPRWWKCFMHTGKVKGQHVGSVWWWQAFFGRGGQKLANLVLLNLIPTPTITELESLGSEVTTKWLHAGVHTRLNDPETHSYMNNSSEFLSMVPLGEVFPPPAKFLPRYRTCMNTSWCCLEQLHTEQRAGNANTTSISSCEAEGN